MKKRIIALVLATLVLMGTLAGCGGGETEPQNSDAAGAGEDTGTGTLKAPNSKKLKSFPESYDFWNAEGGWYYEDDNDKYGIISIDGSSDTKAKFDFVDDVGIMFSVITDIGEIKDVTDYNCFDLVNNKGEVLTSQKYASFQALNERYFVAITIEKEVSSEDDALIVIGANDEAFSTIHADDDDIYCGGTWCIFDAEKKQLVEGATGTTNTYSSAIGDFLIYENDNGTIIIDGEGNKLPENATVFEDSSYAVEDSENFTFYDKDSTELFKISAKEYSVYGVSSGYFVVRNFETSQYSLLDKTGAEVVSGLDTRPYAYGKIIVCEDAVYDFDKNEIYAATGTLTEAFDSVSNAVVVVEDDKNAVYIGTDGKIIATVPKTATTTVSKYECLVQDGDFYYNLKTNAFDIEGYAEESWLVSNGKRGENTLIEVICGKAVIEGKYDYFYTSPTVYGNTIYVVANSEESNDLYCITF